MLRGWCTKAGSLRGFEQGDEMHLHRFLASQKTVHDLHGAGGPPVGVRIIELFYIFFDQQQVSRGLGGIEGQIKCADVHDEVAGAGQSIKLFMSIPRSLIHECQKQCGNQSCPFENSLSHKKEHRLRCPSLG